MNFVRQALSVMIERVYIILIIHHSIHFSSDAEAYSNTDKAVALIISQITLSFNNSPVETGMFSHIGNISISKWSIKTGMFSHYS